MQRQIIHIILLFVFGIHSCSKPKNEKVVTLKEVFPNQVNSDSILVISLDSIKSFGQLENVVCKNKNRNKNLYLRNSKVDVLFNINRLTKCSKGISLIKMRNVITVNYTSDTIFHNLHSESFTVKNYQKILIKQLLNRDKELGLSYTPEKVVTFLSLGNNITGKDEKPLKIIKKLDTITRAYTNFLNTFKLPEKLDSLKNEYPLNLSVDYQLTFKGKTPPPPKPIPLIVREK